MNQKPFADFMDSIPADMLVSFKMNRSFVYPYLIALKMWVLSSNFDKVLLLKEVIKYFKFYLDYLYL